MIKGRYNFLVIKKHQISETPALRHGKERPVLLSVSSVFALSKRDGTFLMTDKINLSWNVPKPVSAASGLLSGVFKPATLGVSTTFNDRPQLPGTGGTSRGVYVSLPDNCCMVLHAPWSTSYPYPSRDKPHAFRHGVIDSYFMIIFFFKIGINLISIFIIIL